MTRPLKRSRQASVHACGGADRRAPAAPGAGRVAQDLIVVYLSLPLLLRTGHCDAMIASGGRRP